MKKILVAAFALTSLFAQAGELPVVAAGFPGFAGGATDTLVRPAGVPGFNRGRPGISTGLPGLPGGPGTNGGINPMQRFMRCEPAEFIADNNIIVELKRQRVGSYTQAHVTFSYLMPVRDAFSITEAPLLIEGDIYIGSIYSGKLTDGRAFDLSVNTTQANAEGLYDGTLSIDADKRAMSCEMFVVAF